MHAQSAARRILGIGFRHDTRRFGSVSFGKFNELGFRPEHACFVFGVDVRAGVSGSSVIWCVVVWFVVVCSASSS